MDTQPTPDAIMRIGTGFMASKTLLTATELGLFTVLGDGPLTGAELGDRLGLHQRGRSDFFDALVSLGLLAREGDAPDATYSNTDRKSVV